MRQANSSLEKILKDLAKTTIVSPISGEVLHIGVKPGETVVPSATNMPGSVIMTIADTSQMIAEVQVDEANILSIMKGQRVEVFSLAEVNTPFPGVVSTIASTTVNSTDGGSFSYRVRIVLDPMERGKVLPGMSCRAEILTRHQENALVIPLQCLRYEEDGGKNTNGRPFVFLTQGGVAKMQFVELGEISNDVAQEVIAGLVKGQQVVSGPYRVLRFLQNGDKLKLARP